MGFTSLIEFYRFWQRERMKKAIITGLNGTVAPYVKSELEKNGIMVFKWDRNAVSISDKEGMIQFLEVLEPDYFFHLAISSIEWTSFLASYCFENKIKFVFTSTESVFSGNGPFSVSDVPNSTSDYGAYKILSEKTIRKKNQYAYIIRLGWQIGDSFEKNNMLNYLEKTYQKQGYIEGSNNWILSASYLKETAKWIVKIALDMQPDLYHIEGNDNLSFYELVKLIEKKFHKDWNVRIVGVPKQDNRLIDSRINVKKVKEIFKTD